MEIYYITKLAWKTRGKTKYILINGLTQLDVNLEQNENEPLIYILHTHTIKWIVNTNMKDKLINIIIFVWDNHKFITLYSGKNICSISSTQGQESSSAFTPFISAACLPLSHHLPSVTTPPLKLCLIDIQPYCNFCAQL